MTENNVTTTYALPAKVRNALQRADRLADGVPVSGTIWADLSSIAKVDAVGIALTVQHLAARPVEIDGEVVRGVVAFSRALGMSSHGTVSHWVTVLGWLQDSATPVSADTHRDGITAYNGGKDHRAKVKATVPVIASMETDAARVQRWAELAAGAKVARSVAAADATVAAGQADESSDDTRAAQPNDGTDTVETFGRWFADLQALQARLYVDGDPEAVRFALTTEQADEVQGILQAIGAATVGDPIAV